MWEKTSVLKKVLDEITKIIEKTGLFPKLQKSTSNLEFYTEFKAKMSIPTSKLLNKNFLNIMKEFSTKLQKENYDIELHPYGVGVAYVFKPNVQKLAQKNLSATELTNIFKKVESKSLLFRYEAMEDYYEGTVEVSSNFDYDTMVRMLEELELKINSE